MGWLLLAAPVTLGPGPTSAPPNTAKPPTTASHHIWSRPAKKADIANVTTKGAGESFDDPCLRVRKIGVQLIGDDGVNSPPAQALARRGIVENVRGFPIYGDY